MVMKDLVDSGLKLVEINPGHMKRPEVSKKCKRMGWFEEPEAVAEEVANIEKREALNIDSSQVWQQRDFALSLAAGIPRLMERLDKILKLGELDHFAILNELELKAKEYSEELLEEELIQELLKRQDPRLIYLLAYLSIFEQPVPELAIQAALEGSSLDISFLDLQFLLKRSVELGLVELSYEKSRDQQWDRKLYYLPEIFESLAINAYGATVAPQAIEHKLSSEVERKVSALAAEALYYLWWKGGKETPEAQALEIHRLAFLGNHKELAVEIAYRIGEKWIYNSRFREVENISGTTLQLVDDFRVLHSLATVEYLLGRPTAKEHYEQALESAKKMESFLTEFTTLSISQHDLLKESVSIRPNLAWLLARQGEVQRALVLLEEALYLERKLGNKRGQIATMYMIGVYIAQQGGVDKAMQMWQEALKLAKQIGDLQAQAVTIHQMGIYKALQGYIEEAIEMWEKTLQLSKEIGEKQIQAGTKRLLAVYRARQGNLAGALNSLEEVLKLSEQIGDLAGQAATLNILARLTAYQGDFDSAYKHIKKALQLFEGMQEIQGKAYSLHNLAKLHAQQGKIKEALKVLEESLKLKKQISDVFGQNEDQTQIAINLARLGKNQGKEEKIVNALELLEETLKIDRAIGNVYNQGLTLHQIGIILAERGEREKAAKYFQEAINLLTFSQAYLELPEILYHYAILYEENKNYLAQALWLAFYLPIPLDLSFLIIQAAVSKLSRNLEDILLIYAVGCYLVNNRWKKHPDLPHFQNRIEGIKNKWAKTVQVSREEFQQKFDQSGLIEQKTIKFHLDNLVKNLVDEQDWFFDQEKILKLSC